MKKTFLFLFSFVVPITLLTTPLYAAVNHQLTNSNKTLTLSYSESGSSDMDDYNGSNAPWNSIKTTITKVIINQGVTSIGAHAFDGCTNLAEITIPASVRQCREKAFYSCSVLKKLHAASPNDWASIDFVTTTSNNKEYCYSHPFCASSSQEYYFYGNASKSTILVFTPGIEVIKKYAFLGGTSFTSVNLPGSVTKIEKKALHCSFSDCVINRVSAPVVEEDGISFTASANLYIPTNATGYTTSIWSSPTKTNKAISGNTLGEKGANVTWNLDSDGILTLDASSPSASKVLTINAASDADMPWYRFRRLVHKIVIKGEVTALNSLLHYHYGISEVVINQATIPTHDATNIATQSSTAYANLFNSRDKLILRVRKTSRESAAGIAALKLTPWNDATHWTIAEIETATIAENADNSDVLNDLSTKPSNAIFDVQLSRTLRNVSFNSFCSPVDMSAEQVTDIFGAGTEIYTLVSSSYDPIANELALNLSENQTAIEAGKPYVIKPANDAPTITLADVAPSTVATAAQTIETDVMDFHGLLSPYTLDGDKFLVVSANNELNWTESGTLKGMRSYFTLKPGVPAQAMAAKARLVFADESPEAITNIEVEQPVQKIMRNGQLLIVRDGVTYNTMGQIVE